MLATRLPSGLATMLGLQSAPIEARPRGRSRYSKALPSVPIVSDAGINGSLPPLPPLPPIPSAGTDPESDSLANNNGKSIPNATSIARKPVGSSVPNPDNSASSASSARTPSPLLPASSSAGSSAGSSTPSSTAAPMIPRRPVAGALRPPALPALIAPPEPSPTDSICSLLSAYAREPDDSLSGSTYTTVSTSNRSPDSRNSSSTATGKDPFGGRGRENAPAQSSAVTSSHHRRPSGPADASPPAPPPKGGDLDKLNSQAKPLPVVPRPEQTASSNPSKLWKRRSQTANKNKDLPDLKLNLSYRSNASISTNRTAVSRTSSDTITDATFGAEESRKQQRTPPRPPVKGLPGRNVRSADKANPTDNHPCSTYSMGGVASKVNNLKHKWGTSIRTSEKLNRIPSRSDSMRPPTPEYRKGDVDPPSTPGNNDMKPASPVSATGSEEAKMTKTTDLSHKPLPQPFLPSAPPSALPSETESKPAISYNSASINSIPKRKQLAAAPEPRLATSPADSLGQKRSLPSHDEAFPATRRANFPPTPSKRNRGHGHSPDPGLNRCFKPPAFALDGAGIVPAAPHRPATASGGHLDPRLVYAGATQEPMYRGRDGTLYAEMKVVESPDPKAFYFPGQTMDKPLAGEGSAIIASKPLSQSHFNCYHKHKTMNRRSNRYYSLTCQTCDKADTEDRWVCTFCHLRICDSCLRAFNGHQRVLRSLVDQLSTSTPLSLPSLSRPASAPGVDVELST
ncbi:hypothetical protein E4U21_000795 [Claviceps maximensis]|nr:hypothetical protein E4U21_000795 [Claviceps maximensis]